MISSCVRSDVRGSQFMLVQFTYVTVPCRNLRLFRCIFYCVRNAVSLNLISYIKGGAHMHLVNLLVIEDLRGTY